MRSIAEDEGRQRRYTVTGQVFFASADAFIASFDFREVIDKVVIDVSRAHFRDITAVSAPDKVVVKFRRVGRAPPPSRPCCCAKLGRPSSRTGPQRIMSRGPLRPSALASVVS